MSFNVKLSGQNNKLNSCASNEQIPIQPESRPNYLKSVICRSTLNCKQLYELDKICGK